MSSAQNSEIWSMSPVISASYAPRTRSGVTWLVVAVSVISVAQPLRERLQLVGAPEVVVDTVLVGGVHLDVLDLPVADRVDAARREEVLPAVHVAVAAVRFDDAVVADRPERDVVDVDPGPHQRAEERDYFLGAVLHTRERMVPGKGPLDVGG